MAELTLPPRYELGEPIGGGEQAVVYQATDTLTGRPVVAKVARQPWQTAAAVLAGEAAVPPWDRDAAAAVLEREAVALMSVDDDRVVKLYDADIECDVPYLILEHVGGEDLESRIAAKPPLRMRESLHIAAEIADVLTVVHKAGYVHRDVNPRNIRLTPAGVKLLDFGLAVSLDPAVRDVTADQGAPGYIAPERIPREPGVPVRRGGPAADLYALGALTYQLVTGIMPFWGRNEAEIRAAQREGDPTPLALMHPGVPPELDRVVMSMLDPCPQARPPSAAYVQRVFQTIAAGNPRGDFEAAPGAERGPTNASTPWRPPRPQPRPGRL
ncbi:MAG: serine/threonine protein kinase, partial [Streptomycetaceae bacterium]|nr:serine/threonine protein kinase [Streptomycetaceae bacterium]